MEYDRNPKYLGMFLGRSLTYRPQLAHTRHKLRSRTNMLCKLAGTTWGCTAKTLRITTQAMVMSVANYCSPIWMNSAHVNQVDTQVYKSLRIVSGTVDSTEIEWLHVLSNTVPMHLARQEAALKECRKIPIYNDITAAPNDLRLPSRKPFWCFFRESEHLNELKERWKQWWNCRISTSKKPSHRPNSSR